MSLSSVATRGYRNSVSLVAIRGYGGAAAPAAEPSAVILRRRKTKIWEEEPRLPEVLKAEETKAAYESLVSRRDTVQENLRRLAKVKSARNEYNALRSELTKLRRDLGTTEVKLAIEQQEAEMALKRYNAAQQEEEEVREIIMFVVQLWE